MAFVNFATHEITAKIVYYGPGLGGKTTALQYIHNNLSPDNRGKMISLATEEDRTIYFDFLPLHLGKIQDFAVRVQLYTVPGQVRYNATRKLVLRGADGVVFVADSQKHKKLSNLESFSNLEENLREHGKELKDLPHVVQFNKIDLPNIMPAGELNQILNKYKMPHFETCATLGLGIMEALKNITKLVFNDLGKKALLQKKTTSSSPGVISSISSRSAAEQPVAAPASTSGPVYFSPSEQRVEETYVSASQPSMDNEVEYSLPDADEPVTSSIEPDPELAIEPVELEEEMLEEVEPIIELEEEDEDASFEQFSPESAAANFTYSNIFQESEQLVAMAKAMEAHMANNETGPAMQTARRIYACLVDQYFPKNYGDDGHEPLLMLALNVKFKRYLRFKSLIESEEAQLTDLLFVHHFLTDLYLSLKEL